MRQEYILTPEQMEMTREELAKDVKMRIALQLLQELDTDIDVEWIRQDNNPDSGVRRIVQVEG